MCMKSRILFCGLMLAVFFMSASAQDKAAMDEMMKKWMEMASPGEAHKKLGDFVGTWETTSTMWMEGPDKNPTVTKGTCETKWVLDGRFIIDDFKGEMMGKPFLGIGLTGYDNLKKKYVGFWADNSSTAMYMMEGNFDQSGKVLTLWGKADDMMTGERDKIVMYVLKLDSKDKHTFEFHDSALPAGKSKVGEIIYVRKK